MIKCTVKLKSGEEITFDAPTMEAAIDRYNTEHRNRSDIEIVYFDEEENEHVPSDRRRDL